MASENQKYMFLRDNYYTILDIQQGEQNSTFKIKILPDCTIFEGHFPGNPICPGVCNIEIIRECACLLTGKELSIAGVKQCRFTTVAKPEDGKELTVQVQATPNMETGSYTIDGIINDAANTYVTFKGEMK